MRHRVFCVHIGGLRVCVRWQFFLHFGKTLKFIENTKFVGKNYMVIYVIDLKFDKKIGLISTQKFQGWKIVTKFWF